MTEQEEFEFRARLEAEQANQPTQQPVQAQQQPKEAPSGLLKGLEDPLTALAQFGSTLLAKSGAAGDVGTEANRLFQEQINKREAQYQTERKAAGEKGFDWSRVGGNLLNPLTWAGGTKVLPIAAAATAGQPVFGEASTENYWTEKAKQLGWNTVGAKAGKVVGEFVGRVFSPKVREAEQIVRELGVTPTTGEALGGAFAAGEKTLGRTPFIRKLVAPAQERSIEQFNTGIINKPLKDLGLEPVAAGTYGTKAMTIADQQLSKRYDDILDNFSVTYQPQIRENMLQNITEAGAPKKLTKAATNFFEQRVFNKLKPGEEVTGQTIKTIDKEVRTKINKYLNSDNVEYNDLGDILQDTYNIWKNNLRSTNPEAMNALKATDKAFAELEVVRKAILKAQPNEQSVRIFKPNQLVDAVEAMGNTRFGKKMVSEGRGLLQREAEAGQAILQASQGVSGEASVGLLGALYAAQSNPALAGGIVAGTGLLYTRMGQKAADKLLRQRPDIAIQIGNLIQSQGGNLTPAIGAQINKVIQESIEGRKEMRRQDKLKQEDQPPIKQKSLFNQSQSTQAIKDQIVRTAIDKGVPDEVLRVLPAIAKVESGFDPMAKNKNSTASGLFQLTKAARQDVGVTDPFNVQQNIEGGTDYFMMLYNRFNGDIRKALAAYNQGAGNVNSKAGREYANKVLRNI
jgi:hypothetical protein